MGVLSAHLLSVKINVAIISGLHIPEQIQLAPDEKTHGQTPVLGRILLTVVETVYLQVSICGSRNWKMELKVERLVNLELGHGDRAKELRLQRRKPAIGKSTGRD